MAPSSSGRESPPGTNQAAAAAATAADDNDDAEDPAFLAPRSRLARAPPHPYYADFTRARADLWSQSSNPGGAIVLSVAENQLCKGALGDRLAAAPRFPDAALGYQELNFRGTPSLRLAMARAMQQTLLRRRGRAAEKEDEEEEEEEERRRLAADLYLACGAGAILDLLFHLVASPGDGVLIPAPYYPTFDTDLSTRDAAVPVPVYLNGLEDGLDRSSAAASSSSAAAAAAAAAAGPLAGRPSLSQQLDAAAGAWEAAQAASSRGGGGGGGRARVRALLLTNPSNPLGTVLKRAQLLEMARWAHARGVHLVCDEIYGAMVWGEEEEEDDDGDDDDDGQGADLPPPPLGRDGERFVSAWRLLTGGEFARQLGGDGPQARCEALTHVVWGLSKDFCASGLRVGALLTRNPGVGAAWGKLSYFSGVPFPLQHALADVLGDERWVRQFHGANRAALRASWRALAGALDEARIPYVRGARAAMFCWIDLREGLAAFGGEEAGAGGGWAAERALWRALVRDARVLVTPGEACHAPEPGYFRVCWAWMPREALPIAVRRIRAVLDDARGAISS
jgi:1-aminocyclopropane-1-carboxylate synthase